MAMTPYRRAVAVTGSYTDRQGNEKKRYTPVGTLFQYEDGGFALKLDCVPVGEGWNGFVSFYPIEERSDNAPAERGSGGGGSYDQRRQQTPKASAAADLDDEIPFLIPGDF